MLDRKRLQIDSFLSNKFYERSDNISDIIVEFPTPSSADSLKAFLNSPDGETFKTGFRATVDKLSDWATSHDIQNAKNVLEKFKITYADYSGNNPEINKIYFTLYQFSIQKFAAINKLIVNDDISINTRIDIIRNLINDISVCAPGAFTHITSAQIKLASELDIATEWEVARKSIAEQIVLEGLKKISGIPNSMEIHYVNVILNNYADMLSIAPITDTYIHLCDDNIIMTLLEEFDSAIPKQLTIEAIIDHIVFEIDTQTLPNKFRSHADATEPFFHALAHYGKDEKFDFKDLFVLDDMELVQQISWKAEYLLQSTLFNRLIQTGFINTATSTLHNKISSQTNVTYYKDHSLKFAKIQSDNNSSPFILYCVEQLMPGSSLPDKHNVLEFIMSNNLNDDQRFEIVEGMLTYLNIEEQATAHAKDKTWLTPWIDLIMKILPTHYNFDILLKKSHNEVRNIYLQRLGKNNLIHLIQYHKQLNNLLTCLTPEKATELLHQLGSKKLQLLVDHNLGYFITVLRFLPETEWHDAFAYILTDKRSAAATPDDFCQLLKLILSRLPDNQWDSFLHDHLGSDWLTCISDMNTLTQIMSALPIEKIHPLLKKFDSHIIHRVIGHQNVLFISIYEWNNLINGLTQLSVEKATILLLYIGPTIKNNLSLKLGADQFFTKLSNEKLEIFLNCIGSDVINKILHWQLGILVSNLSIAKCEFLFNYLGTENLRRAVKSKTMLTSHLNNMPHENADLFLHHYQILTTKNALEDKDYFIYIFKHIKDSLFSCIINQFEKRKLFELLDIHLKSLLQQLSKNKIAKIYEFATDDIRDQLNAKVHTLALKNKSLDLITSIPKEDSKNILAKMDPLAIPGLIHNRFQLVTALALLSVENQIALIENFNPATLKSLLLNKNSIDDTLEYIDHFRECTQMYYILLLALLKAYHEQYTEDKHSLISHIQFWHAPDTIKPEDFNRLSSAITIRIYQPIPGIALFSRPALSDTNQHNDLAKITRAFNKGPA